MESTRREAIGNFKKLLSRLQKKCIHFWVAFFREITKIMAQRTTGEITEGRVKRKLEAFGLIVRKPVPDRGVDLVAWFPSFPSRIARIQVKGRNPEKDTHYRWFQIRVSKAQLKAAHDRDMSPDSTWQEKLGKADFLVLDAVKADD
jgi:hypothetical protein